MEPSGSGARPAPLPPGEVLRVGAEAVLVKGEWLGGEALYKVRTRKAYRIPQIDDRIRAERTVTEARILASLLEAGLPVPGLLDVHLKDATIVMEFVHGARLKDVVGPLRGKLASIFSLVGAGVARMHGLNVVHGDLTTSNIIYESPLDSEEIAFRFVDFGLARHTASVEDKSVDVHLFKRVITSTHAGDYDHMFPPFMAGYEAHLEQQGRPGEFKKVERRLEQIETRGRYVEKSKRK
ncbi:MAG: Kae1-associated kinase Bud32 [Candidatus Lokiarchaeota archaeon]|nr:Kae1-associated kinase Bud32 [Candidatus Lokiarchaeota archaeon]